MSIQIPKATDSQSQDSRDDWVHFGSVDPSLVALANLGQLALQILKPIVPNLAQSWELRGEV